MTPAEFVNRMVGKPWKRWAADFEACDCFGLLVLWYRHVLGVELGEVPQTDLATGFQASAGWEQCGQEEGATAWMSWSDGAPRHCGVVLFGGVLLHCEGREDRPGSVRVTKLSAIRRMAPDVRFYRRAAC